MWDAETGAELQAFIGHDDPISDVALSSNGEHVLTGDQGGVAKVWDAETGRLKHTFVRHRSPITTVCFFPGGDKFLTAGSDGMMFTWNTQYRPPLAAAEHWAGYH